MMQRMGKVKVCIGVLGGRGTGATNVVRLCVLCSACGRRLQGPLSIQPDLRETEASIEGSVLYSEVLRCRRTAREATRVLVLVYLGSLVGVLTASAVGS